MTWAEAERPASRPRPSPPARRPRGGRRRPGVRPSPPWPADAPISRWSWPAGRRVDAVVDALVRSEAELSRIDDAITEAEGLRSDAADLATRAGVASELGRHLAAGGFERWLLDEALLAAGRRGRPRSCAT